MYTLTYNRKSDRFQTITVLGDAVGIQDLYWQLTHNYQPVDGTAIGNITVKNLDGDEISYSDLMQHPHTFATKLSSIEE